MEWLGIRQQLIDLRLESIVLSLVRGMFDITRTEEQAQFMGKNVFALLDVPDKFHKLDHHILCCVGVIWLIDAIPPCAENYVHHRAHVRRIDAGGGEHHDAI
jgi:hypothetical protein